jgi:4a-hydroxytetrahydrobiopterin dehydratase
MNELQQRHCQPLDGHAPMDDAAIAEHLRRVPGWSLDGGAIERVFTFSDFHATMAFVNALAWVAHREDHHPDLQLSYSRCTVRFSTHSVGGISVNDFICAAKLNALLN